MYKILLTYKLLMEFEVIELGARVKKLRYLWKWQKNVFLGLAFGFEALFCIRAVVDLCELRGVWDRSAAELSLPYSSWFFIAETHMEETLMTIRGCPRMSARASGKEHCPHLYEKINSKVRGMSARKKVVMSADVRTEGGKTGNSN